MPHLTVPDTDHVKDEEDADKHKHDEEECEGRRGVEEWLIIQRGAVHGLDHDGRPVLKRSHLKAKWGEVQRLAKTSQRNSTHPRYFYGEGLVACICQDIG